MAARRLAAPVAIVLGLALLPGRAEAHAASAVVGDFYAGALHLLTSPEYLLSLVGLGLLLGSGERDATAEPFLLLLPLALGIGAVLSLGTGPVAVPRFMGVFWLLFMGLLVAAAVRLARLRVVRSASSR